MSDDQLKVGDLVRLKSGGPKMTVARIGTVSGLPGVVCTWFDGTKRSEATFPPETLDRWH